MNNFFFTILAYHLPSDRFSDTYIFYYECILTYLTLRSSIVNPCRFSDLVPENLVMVAKVHDMRKGCVIMSICGWGFVWHVIVEWRKVPRTFLERCLAGVLFAVLAADRPSGPRQLLGRLGALGGKSARLATERDMTTGKNEAGHKFVFTRNQEGTMQEKRDKKREREQIKYIRHHWLPQTSRPLPRCSSGAFQLDGSSTAGTWGSPRINTVARS